MLNQVIKSGSEVSSLEEVKENILNFEVMEKPLTFKGLDDTTDILSDKKITYRVGTSLSGFPELIKLGEVGKNYQVLQNSKFVDDDKDIAESGLVTLSGAGFLSEGRKVFLQYKSTTIEPVPGDQYECFLLKFNSHDGSTLVGYSLTITRVVCLNTFQRAINAKSNRILACRHTKNMERNLDEIKEAIDLVNFDFVATEEKLKRLAEITIKSEEDIRKIVKVVFSQKKLENLVSEEDERKPRVLDDIVHLFQYGKGQDIQGVKGTGLALFNAITEYTNHVSGTNRKNQSTPDSRLDSVLFGSSARINDKAMTEILQLA